MNVSTTLAMRIERMRPEALDIVGIDLVATDGSPLPAYAAGSHVDVMLPNGMTRPYSLCSAPGERSRYSIAVLRAPLSRGGSVAVHDLLHEGDTVRISAPRNHFALAHDARRHVLVAGGIGITPILCMAERLAVSGEDFALHYAARSAQRMAFRERVLRLGERASLHLDDGPPSQRLDLDAVAGPAAPGHHLYVCGPTGFTDAVLGAARRHGWQEGALHREYFAPAEPAGGSAAAGSDDADGPFEVRLASTGQVVVVPRGVSASQALAEAGVVVATSCEQGVCGTCLTRVLEGVPDHRDLYLSPDEQAQNDQFTPCCSRAKTASLVLDL